MSNKNKRESIIEVNSKQIEAIPFVSSDKAEFRMGDAYICPLLPAHWTKGYFQSHE